MRKLATLLGAAALALAGCGDDDDAGSAPAPARDEPAMTAEQAATPSQETAQRRRRGTAITVGASEFGRMLFGPNRRAIYIFENDPKGRTVCYGDCADAWPPVFTKGTPRARNGVKQSLLGTVRRRDGRRQVTYAGKPLYYYAHEGPGEVRCHNVDLNGGLWWVVGPDGKRRP
jgi:predicted lipoprotein with Yx(FWY)xxD motif